MTHITIVAAKSEELARQQEVLTTLGWAPHGEAFACCELWMQTWVMEPSPAGDKGGQVTITVPETAEEYFAQVSTELARMVNNINPTFKIGPGWLAQMKHLAKLILNK